MKTYTFTVTFEEGNDEFWEENPSLEVVTKLVDQIFFENGIDAEVVLTKYIYEA